MVKFVEFKRRGKASSVFVNPELVTHVQSRGSSGGTYIGFGVAEGGVAVEIEPDEVVAMLEGKKS